MPEALHSSVLETLGQEITAGELGAGSVLTLERLQRRFGVSRTVARECMRLLEQLQLVTSRRRVGIVVRPQQDWDVLDPRVIRWRLGGPGRIAQLRTLTEMRAAVEPFAAARAAQFATDVERAEIAALGTELVVVGEIGARADYIALDIAFHASLLRASRNELFVALIGAVGEVIGGRTHNGLVPRDPSLASLAAHEAVARAVADADAPLAERSMRELLTDLRVLVADLDGL